MGVGVQDVPGLLRRRAGARPLTALRRWWAALPDGLGEAIWLTATARLALTLFALYVANERSIPHPCHFEEARNGWAALPLQYKDGAAFALIGVWERWDGCWYAKIATFGYLPDGSTAFYPLFPLLERVVALAGPHVAIAGMVVNLVATVFALWGLYRVASRDAGPLVARRAMLLLAVFPTAFFLLAPFSEAVFLALAVWSIERARDRRWVAAAALALLAGLARPVGAFLVLPLAWLAWRQSPSLTRPRDLAAALAAVAAAPASAAAYVAYTSAVVGQSMFAASLEWTGAAFHPPWEVAGAAIGRVRETGDPLQALNLALLVLGAALFVVGVRRLPVDLTLYSAPQIYLVWARILPTPLTSTSRYQLVIFPAFIVLALLLGERRLLWSYVILSLLLLAALANEFVIGSFVG